MQLLLNIVLTLQSGAIFAVTERPAFITELEFAAVRGKTIEISNDTLNLKTQDEELNVPQPKAGFGTRLWPNAQVPYTLDPSFDDYQRNQIALAFQAYHENTCIRFIPRQSHHGSWVDILQDYNTCGVAQYCMNYGSQFAKFGGSCVNAGVIVHELGHTLCMGHEQTRRDRDKWITYNTAVCFPDAIDGPDFYRGLNKFYDYVSAEHNEEKCYNGCIQPRQSGVTKCGSGGPLSVLDIEILNEMYVCNAGCYGYRYVNHRSELRNPIAFGADTNGEPLYSCRAYHEGHIIPGKYHAGRRECYVPYYNGEHSKTGDDIEVLTNPNGVHFQWIRSGWLPGGAIRGGRTNERETLYPVHCWINAGGQYRWTPGKYQPSVGAYTSFNGGEVRCNEYEFLVCNYGG